MESREFIKLVSYTVRVIILLTFAASLSNTVSADEIENASIVKSTNTEEFSFSAFLDTAFSYGFNKFDPRNRAYLTQPTRDQEVQVNLAFVDIKLDTERYRGRIALQAGSSVDRNYSAENEEVFRYVQESYGGLKLADGLWLDGGIYLSHIGLESWISRDNWSYTRLLMSEFSPYYESGVKLSYEASKNLTLQLHYLNGWQNITNFDGRSALGTQVAYTFENKTSIVSNSFVGKEPNENSCGTRLFSNFILKAPPIGKLELASSFDVGSQQLDEGGNGQWYAWGLLSRYSVSDSFKLSARAEQYLDGKNILVATSNGEPFKSIGFSVGVDYEIAKGLWWRSEYRAFIAEKYVFATNQTGIKNADSFVISSLSYTF